MPNTLCHIGFQAPVARFIPGIDLRLVILACVLPDIPWILQRILIKAPFINSHLAQLYFVIQASLLFCCILSAALALCTSEPGKSFCILAGNSLFHLLLDACQIKWANGVHLFAPFSWEMLRFDLSWPEYPLWPAVSLFGLFYLVFNWQKIVCVHFPLARLNWQRVGCIVTLLALYFAAPPLFFSPVEKLDNAFLKTLHLVEQRPGKYIEFDRLSFSAGTALLRTKTGEQIELTGEIPKTSGIYSVQGKFITAHQVEVSQFHQHTIIRDIASLLGIFMTCALLLHSVIVEKKRLRHRFF